MHFNWNKRVLASSFAVLSMATSLYAIPKGPCDRQVEEVCCETPKPGPFAFSYPMDLGINCPRDFYVHVDGLAFQAKQDGMEFAIEDTSSSVGVPTSPITYGKVIGFSNDNSDWDYNPGMRFGLGFFLDHDAWEIDFDWTWVNITNYKHGDATTAGSGLIPLWVLGSGTPAVTPGTAGPNIYGVHSSAVWKAHYNTLDLSLGKPYHISRYVIFNPHFGIRGGWIDQHFSVDYQGYIGAANRTIHHGKNNFWGIGARAGLDTDWIVGKGWCLFANMSASMMASKFEIHQNMVLPTVGSTTGDGYDLEFDYYQNVPNVEMALGIAWSKYFDKNKYRIGLRAAYEFIEWWDQLNMRKFYDGIGTSSTASASQIGYGNDTVSRGNLTLNGFSLRLQLDI